MSDVNGGSTDLTHGQKRERNAELLEQGCLFTVIDFLALALASAFAACGGFSLWAYLGTLLVLSGWLWFVIERRKAMRRRQSVVASPGEHGSGNRAA